MRDTYRDVMIDKERQRERKQNCLSYFLTLKYLYIEKIIYPYIKTTEKDEKEKNFCWLCLQTQNNNNNNIEYNRTNHK